MSSDIDHFEIVVNGQRQCVIVSGEGVLCFERVLVVSSVSIGFQVRR